MVQSRTHNCGELRLADAGKDVTVVGWYENIRKVSKNLGFLILRDFYGTTQVVIETEDMMSVIDSVNKESTIQVTGVVRERSSKNAELPTGEIEVVPSKIEVLGKCRYNALPFEINQSKDADENTRLKYRYLDLRREPMQRNIILRSAVTFATREFLTSKGFLEIETPTFIKSTPEGARDYLVPSRVHPGKFYSLPQSPQLYKQLLMVSGFDKYFQIARCYRDEDARGDRQPEFTQIDMEMSFTNREEVLETTEELMRHIFKKTLNYELPVHFDRISWDDAFDLYGSDKPDLRFDMKMQDAAFMADLSDFNAFKAGGANADKNIERHKRSGLKALVVKNAADKYSRKHIEALEAVAKINHAKGLAWMKVDAEGKFEGGISKFFAGKEAEICSRLGAEKTKNGRQRALRSERSASSLEKT